MGSWSSFSASSDAVWDSLYADNIHKMTDGEIKTSLDKYLQVNKLPWNLPEHFENIKTYLGVVIHGLFQGLTLPYEHMERGLKAVNLLLDPEYVNWTGDSAQEKIDALRIEKEAIEYAMAHGCKGKKRHIPGLLEQISDLSNVVH